MKSLALVIPWSSSKTNWGRFACLYVCMENGSCYCECHCNYGGKDLSERIHEEDAVRL